MRLHDATSFGAKAYFVKTPFDFVGHVRGFPFAVEAKETAEKTIPRSKLLRDKSYHQFKALEEWSKSHSRCVAGYLCHLGGVHSILWVPYSIIPQIESVSLDALKVEGVRHIDLTKGRVDWIYLFLGENPEHQRSPSLQTTPDD